MSVELEIPDFTKIERPDFTNLEQNYIFAGLKPVKYKSRNIMEKYNTVNVLARPIFDSNGEYLYHLQFIESIDGSAGGSKALLKRTVKAISNFCNKHSENEVNLIYGYLFFYGKVSVYRDKMRQRTPENFWKNISNFNEMEFF